MVPTVAWMRQKFAEYNAKYFGNELPVPEFEVKQMNNKFGNYFVDAKYNNNTRRVTRVNGNGVITLTNQYSRNENAVISTLLHEMVHEYVYLVMRVYPPNQHGKEFMSIARSINADGWQIEKETHLTDDDTENNGDNGNGCVLFVLKTPERNDFKWRVCKADENNMQAFITSAKKMNGVQSMGFYKCNSSALEHVKSDSNTLLGWGGNTYEEAITKLGRYCGENPEMFYGKNLIRIN